MTEMQRRRFWRAWLPVSALGAILMAVSFTHSVSINGLTLLGAMVGFVGLGLMVWESRDE